MELFPKPSDKDVFAANQFVSGKTIATKKFGDIPIGNDIWSCGPVANRSWLWLLHSFQPLDPLIATGKTDLLRMLVDSWQKKYGSYVVDWVLMGCKSLISNEEQIFKRRARF